MITERDLQEAIAECEGERKPGANTCMKLAAFYTIKNHLYPDPDQNAPGAYRSESPIPSKGYYSAGIADESVVNYDSGSRFSEAINGRKAAEMWEVMDELMDALIAINPRLYESVLRKIK